jgi:PAS domain S-box-containing protein
MAAKQRQKTLGFLGTRLVTPMQNQLWQGAMRAAQEHNARLVYYPIIRDYFSPQTKVPFELVDAGTIDGLLIWYAGIVERIGILQAKHFFDRYKELPVVTIGGQLKDHPNLSIDNYQGVRSAVEHLVEIHGHRHIGIIRGTVGHPDADERYQACIETLEAYHLRSNSDCVAETSFDLRSISPDIEAIISRWLQNPDWKLDAIVTASDYMALAAIKAIEDGGLRVPEDIAVIGFDDTDDARASIPSLTTIRQPFFDLGRQAAETLLALIDGQSVPTYTRIPAQLIVRESCGCIAESLVLANNLSVEHPPDTAALEGLPIEPLKNLIWRLGNNFNPAISHWFLYILRQYLLRSLESDFNTTAWQNTISALRSYALSISHNRLNTQLETLFNQARVLITEVHQRGVICQRLQIDRQIASLRLTSEALITSFSRELLADTLYDRLPELGFHSFYLSLYDDPQQPEMWAHLIIAYENDQRIDLPPEGLVFPTRQLIPNNLASSLLTTPIVVEPLYFGDEQLGILVLEVGTMEGAVYESIRAQVSSALQGSKLLQEIKNHTAQLEQRVAERTEDLTQTVEQLQAEVLERQRVEESLRLTDFAVEHAADAVYWIDVNTQIVAVNEAACLMLGYTREEFSRISLKDIDFAFDFSRWVPTWEFVKETGTFALETVHTTKDSRNIPVEIHTNYIGFEGKELLCCFVRDITQRKQVEDLQRLSQQQTREFQEKLKALQEVSLELVLAETIEKLCIRAIELGHGTLGYDRLGLLLFENADGTRVSRFGIESSGKLRSENGLDYSPQNDSLLSGLLTDRKSVFVEEDAILSDFEAPVGQGWNIVTGIWDGNAGIGWLAADNYFERLPLIPYQVELLNLYGLTIGHLVARKKAEAEIRRLNDELERRVAERTAQLKASNLELESFAYVVSHDLKAPLRGISQLTSWLRADYAEAFDAEGHQMLGLLTKRTQRMYDLIDGILEYSRIGRAKEQKYTFDLNQLVRDVIDGLAPPSHITVRVETRLPTVIGDRTRLEQVFQNLIGNSIKFMDKTEGWISVGCEEEDYQWCFTVSDNGPGIETKYYDKIFQIFQTLDSSDKHEGTGIGLSLVKKIVERWGGRIWIESTVGQGSTFFFTMPYAGE